MYEKSFLEIQLGKEKREALNDLVQKNFRDGLMACYDLSSHNVGYKSCVSVYAAHGVAAILEELDIPQPNNEYKLQTVLKLTGPAEHINAIADKLRELFPSPAPKSLDAIISQAPAG
jgi:hypothetical protein